MNQPLQNVWYLIRCSVFFVLHGTAKKSVTSPKKILIVQMAKLGDMVCTTPMFRAVKTAYPNIRLTVAGNSLNKEVLAGNADMDDYFVFDGDMSKTIQLLKKEKFDAAFLTAPNFPLLACLYLAGIKCIVAPKVIGGFSSQETIPYKILRNFVITQDHPMGSYAPREYVRRLEIIGIRSDDTAKHLFYSEAAKLKARSLAGAVGKKLIVGIAPAAGNRIKQWPAERFGIVANHLISQYGAQVFIIGGKQDAEEARIMKNATADHGSVTDLTGALSIDELKAFISELGLFVSVDTGPIYIAEAFGVPTIDITGPIDEKEQPPIGLRHRVVHIKNREKPALYVMNAKVYDRAEARRQTEEITADMVICEIDSLLAFLNIHL